MKETLVFDRRKQGCDNMVVSADNLLREQCNWMGEPLNAIERNDITCSN